MVVRMDTLKSCVVKLARNYSMEKTAPLFVLQIVRRVVTPTDFVLVKQDGRALIVPQNVLNHMAKIVGIIAITV